MRALTSGLLVLGAAAALVPGCSSGTMTVSDTRQRLISVGEEQAEKKDAKPEKAGAPFELPSDRGGKLLATVLPPRSPRTLNRPDRAPPAAVPAPRFVEPPTTLPAGTSVVTARRRRRARTCCGLVWSSTRGSTARRQTPALRRRRPSRQTGRCRCRPRTCRSRGAADPAQPASIASRSTTSRWTHRRRRCCRRCRGGEKPAPFAKETVPEPFENRKALPTKPADEVPTSPVADGPALPKK